MSRARHKAKGGSVKESAKPVWEAGGETDAAKEAEEKKHGGKVRVHGEGKEAKSRHDRPARRARGGKVDHKEPHHAVKSHSMHHEHGMHIPGRKRGGGVGADMHPLTTASKVKHITKGEEPEEGVRDEK